MSYTMNLLGFESFMKKELNAYLKLLNSLGLLSVSLKECRSVIGSGIAVERSNGRLGRPKKCERPVSDDDILSDLTSKASLSKCSKLSSSNGKAETKRLEKEAKSLARSESKLLKLAAKAAAKDAKAAVKAAAKAEKAAVKAAAKDAKVAAKKLLKEEKAAKSKAALARKSKEAKALKKQFNITSIDCVEELTEETIFNENGSVVGSKVSSFTLAECPAVVKETEDVELPDGLELFKHASRPNETLYKDEQDDVFVKISKDEFEHVAAYDSANGTLIVPSDSGSDSDLDELSDTE